jgi:Domain of unknown function (DUF4126)
MDHGVMSVVEGLAMGVALAAACGFRVFVPMLVMSVALQTGAADSIPLADNFHWLASPLATVVLGVATAVEIAGYYIPWVDNLLDTIATPAAAVAGTVVTASMLGGLDPTLQWGIGVIAGGGTATGVQLLSVTTRAASTATTGGAGNPVVSTAEAGGSILVSILAIVIPIVIAIIVLGLLAWAVKKVFFAKKKQPPTAAPPAADG